MSDTFQAIGELINQNPKAPELLSLFLDAHLRLGIDEPVHKAMTLVWTLRETDSFEAYYAQHLADRLVTPGGSTEERLDAELQVIAMLQVVIAFKIMT